MSRQEKELKPGSLLAGILSDIYNAQIDINYPEKLTSVAEIVDKPKPMLDALEEMGFVGFASGIPFVTDEGREWLKKNKGKNNAKR